MRIARSVLCRGAGERIAARLSKNGCMTITLEIFEAFLKCRTKAHLIGHGVAVDHSAIDPPLKELDDTYRHRGSDELWPVFLDGAYTDSRDGDKLCPGVDA
jgi:hypothetical protein